MCEFLRDPNYNDPQEELDCDCGQDPCICPHPVECRCVSCEADRGEYFKAMEGDEELKAFYKNSSFFNLKEE